MILGLVGLTHQATFMLSHTNGLFARFIVQRVTSIHGFTAYALLCLVCLTKQKKMVKGKFFGR